MTEQQPGDVLDEAVRLLAVLRRRAGALGGSARRAASGGPGGGDAWGDAVDEAADEAADEARDAALRDPHIATGAPECRNCPICRAIAVARESGPDAGRHARAAGRSLLAAGLDVVAAFERTRGGARPRPDAGPPHTRRTAADEPAQAAPAQAAPAQPAKDAGDPWSAATGGDPIDIG
ncbi:hypothetical protein [Actinomadura parmotrematis]|uniref:Uncharacterized protein n=1 Tax=Actinomadura parmotrematis TaxID=2864039 RepID=A0ABS7FKI7_9ACTN|nr:hypothetical protein [Actinomadura parmotrematis]MBW8480872.1 hypothetical protein [Actinomadura parmotrematis]